MDASKLVDEIVEALGEHPDAFWAKRQATQRIREWLAEKSVDCPECGAEVCLLEDDA